MPDKKKPKSEAVKKRERKEERFCILYTTPNSPTYKNGQKAAEKAGWAKKSARSTASTLLTKPNISKRINGILDKQTKKLELSADKVLKEISTLAFSNIQDLFDDNDCLKPISELTRDQAAIISSLEIDEITVGKGEDRKPIGAAKKMKLWSKIKSLEMLASHFALLKNEPGDGDEDDIDEAFL